MMETPEGKTICQLCGEHVETEKLPLHLDDHRRGLLPVLPVGSVMRNAFSKTAAARYYVPEKWELTNETVERSGYSTFSELPWPPQPPHWDAWLGYNGWSIASYLHALGERQKKHEEKVAQAFQAVEEEFRAQRLSIAEMTAQCERIVTLAQEIRAIVMGEKPNVG